MGFSGICSGEREERSGFIIWPAILLVESIIDGLTVPVCDEGQVASREERCTVMLKKEMKTLTAERVYEVLRKEALSETQLGQLEVGLPGGRSQLLAES